MNNKKILFKNVFYIFVAALFVGAGFLFFPKNLSVYGLDTSTVGSLGEQSLLNNKYFVRKDFVKEGETEQPYQNSLIDFDTFMYSSTENNSLRLSFLLNGGENGTYNSQDIFNHVYYENLDDRDNFLFFTEIKPELFINGVLQDLSDKSFVETFEDERFDNASSSPLQGFEMIFDDSGSQSNAISIKNGDEIIEGVYELAIEYVTYTCTNGTSDLSELNFLPSEGHMEKYTFFVTDRTEYLLNNHPNISKQAFDNVLEVSATQQSTNSFELFSNYSSQALIDEQANVEGTISQQDKNKIPYIEFDYLRFEANFVKEFSNTRSLARLKFNIDSLKGGENAQESPVIYYNFEADEETETTNGKQIVNVVLDKESHRAKVYFTDLGEYTIALKPIQVLEIETDRENHTREWQKFMLDGMETLTKNIKVHMFGYGLNYTDFDSPADQNNSRQIKELKDFDFQKGEFVKSADITSDFLHSNPNFSQDPEKTSSTFTRTNIFKFINETQKGETGEELKGSDGNPIYVHSAVKTNQTPLRFLSNVNQLPLSNVSSKIYATTQINSNFTPVTGVSGGFQGDALYESDFEGLTENTPGKYVYVVSYTYDGFSAPEQIFRQVFFFEIVKELSTIQVHTADGTQILTGDFVNKDVKINDTTKEDKYNKKITVRIYAWDYAAGQDGDWLEGFTSSGKNLLDLPKNGTDQEYERTISKESNARYTLRLYYTSDIMDYSGNYDLGKLDFYNGYGFLREQTFTIDSNPVDGITARNFQQITGSSYFSYHSTIDNSSLKNFSTNQPIAFSWNEKKSKATTWAYYRYFPLQDGALGKYYSQNSSKVDEILKKILYGQEVMPINRVLDLRTSFTNSDGVEEKRNWLPYAGNTFDLNRDYLDSQYILSDAGLYILDVYDSAGNHSLETFFIDNSTPMFAIHDETGYAIPTSPFINKATTLYWGKFKAIYIAGLDGSLYSAEKNPTSEELTEDFYKTYYDYVYKDKDSNPYGNSEELIYKLIREKLFDKNKIQYFEGLNVDLSTSEEDISSLIKDYNGLYVTIPIDSTSYYMDETEYQSQNNVFSKNFDEPLQEMTYTILIRDESNTKRFTQWSEDVAQQFTSYYSARQTIIISFDTSQFFIEYAGGTVPLTSNNKEVDESGQALTTYLSPTRLSNLILTFRPTTVQENQSIQVDKVTMQYFAFSQHSKIINETRYSYSAFSEEASKTAEYYSYENNPETELQYIELNLDSTGFTAAGKYVITRTYKTGESFTINSQDYLSRTYILIVDRNDVITNQELVQDTNETAHLENLVGGDIFVSMYDTGANANLVVTFPNSENSNTDSTTLYSNSLTTNELPVKIYIPQFKYTTYTEKIKMGQSGYQFKVRYNFATEEVIVDDKSPTPDLNTMNYFNFKKNNLIREYALYAEIYKGTNPALVASAKPIAVTSKGSMQDILNPTLDSVKLAADGSGFLNFFNYENAQPFTMIYQPDTYYVRIYQGFFTSSTADNYMKTFDFRFTVEKTTPDFDVRLLDASLNSDKYSSGEIAQTYYTNQPILEISWDISQSKFMADIDESKLKFRTDQETFVYDLNGNDVNHQDIWIKKPEIKNGRRYSGQLDLRAINGAYRNEGYVDITMQYKNHDVAVDETGKNLYSTITKRISVDLCAPSDNVEMLVAKSLEGNTISLFNHEALRTYKKATKDEKGNETTTDLLETSYNVSTSSGLFAYYSFSVTKDYLTTLQQQTQDVTTYIRKFKNGEINTKYTDEPQETSPVEFYESNFSVSDAIDQLETDTYYEVIEMDRARNMSIYTIYVADTNSEQNLIEYVDGNDNRHSYTKTDYDRTNANAGSIHNIFARKGFELRKINFFGDAWARMRLTTFKKTSDGNISPSTINLMLTPYDQNSAYIFSGSSSPQKVSIPSLIDGQESLLQKHSLTIFNKLNAQNTANPTFYFNIFNTRLNSRLTDVQTRELISFENVTDAQIQNTQTASPAFVTAMKITIDDKPVYYGGVDAEGNYLPVQNPLGYASLWQNFTQNSTSRWSNDELVRVYISNERLYFEINPNYPTSRNARVKYEFTDNYGEVYNETHIFKETVINKEVSSENESKNPLYAYYDSSAVLHYIIKDGLQFNFNANKYHVEYFEIEANESEILKQTPTHMQRFLISTSNGVTTWTFRTTRTESEFYRDNFVIELYDSLEYSDNGNSIERIKPIKEINFTFYDQLPKENLDITKANDPGYFQLRDVKGDLIKKSDLLNGTQGYYSQVRVTYNLLPTEETFIPAKFMYRTENGEWTELASGERLQNTSGDLEKFYLKIWYDEQFLQNELGNGAYIFENVPQSQIFEFSLSSLSSNYWIEKTIDGITTRVEKAEHSFKAKDGSQYSNHYIVNTQNIHINVNKEQDIEITNTTPDDWKNADVLSERYLLSNKKSISANSNTPVFETTIVITYIPNEKDFLKAFYCYDTNGTVNTNENLVTLNRPEKMLVIPKDLTLDRTQLVWQKSFAYEENEISVEISLGDMKLSPVTYTKNIGDTQYNYIYLTYSGLYKIRFIDAAGNVQMFANRDATGAIVDYTDTFEFIFLKDVPFTVTVTNLNPETGQEETSAPSLPIKQAIYNGKVTINIDPSTLSRFYRDDGRPSFTDVDVEHPENSKYLIKRNGEEYHKDFESTTQFTFDEPGYYEIAFSATSSLPNVGAIRQETFQFAIINQDEYKVSHVHNIYGNYYIEKVVKVTESAQEDITEQLVATMDFNKVTINGKSYLTQLALSYLDEKTGVGEYVITVNTNNRLYNSENLNTTFTYRVKINSGTAPLRISLKEGESTTGSISINYNLSNLFLEMGKSTLRIMRLADNGRLVETANVDVNSASTGEGSLNINTTGTYFIQILSPSGNLLFTYKVIRNEPLNTAAIIAIVIGSIVLVAVIVIIIKLRKRIAVK